jgi:hypothetical protein
MLDIDQFIFDRKDGLRQDPSQSSVREVVARAVAASAAVLKALGEPQKAEIQTLYRAIHSVTNPIPRFTGAIHVYGGDFFGPVGRSEWDAETLVEQSCDGVRMARRFEEANTLLRRT